MATVIDASDQLIATLRQSYIYETGVLSDIQMGYVAQIKVAILFNDYGL